MKWKWKCLGHLEERKKRQERRGLSDGLSRDRLTEVMRGEDESEEHDSRIQIQSRLTLLEYVSFSKSFYPIYSIPLCTALTLTALLVFCTGLSSQYILLYLFSCYLLSLLSFSLSLEFTPYNSFCTFSRTLKFTVYVGHHTFPVLQCWCLRGCNVTMHVWLWVYVCELYILKWCLELVITTTGRESSNSHAVINCKVGEETMIHIKAHECCCFRG